MYVAPVTASEDVTRDTDRAPIRRLGGDRPLGARDVTEKTADLEEALKEALAGVARVVDRPGPGVLTVATVVTDLDPNRPTMSQMSAEPGLDFQSISLGGAAVRVELRDGDRVLAVIEDDSPDRRFDDPMIQGSTMWTEANSFFRRFSRDLADLLA